MIEEPKDDPRQSDESLTLWQVAASVLAAFFGVQKDSVRRRDLSKGKPSQFIIIGLIATVLFILTVMGVVSLVMSAAGA